MKHYRMTIVLKFICMNLHLIRIPPMNKGLEAFFDVQDSGVQDEIHIEDED